MGVNSYVVYTEVNADQLACDEIESKLGFDCVALKLVRERRFRGNVVQQKEFIFQRYVFAAFDITRDPWQEIYSCRGVDKILGNRSNHPTPVPDQIIIDLKAAFAAGKFSPPPPPPPLAEGEEGRVIAGDFVNRIGKCINSRPGRVQLLLSIFGGVGVSLPAHIVERVGPVSNAAIRLENRQIAAV